MKKYKSDCEVIFDSTNKMFSDLGNCLDTAFDEKKTKMNVVGSIFNFGKSLAKMTFNVGYCAVKNTPKAVLAVAAVKKEVVTAIENEIHEHQKKLKEDALNEKIKHLKLKV